MRQIIILSGLLFLLISCSSELAFEKRSFTKKTTLPCKENCPEINVKIPFAKDVPVVADSINKKVFFALKEIIYLEKKPFHSTNYNELLASLKLLSGLKLIELLMPASILE